MVEKGLRFFITLTPRGFHTLYIYARARGSFKLSFL